MPVKRPDIEEFAYTTKKIEANFSNFSAWHQRSKTYPLLWESNALDRKKSQEEGAARAPALASERCA
jgi:geranylgeranyl transferase type-2 subunit alpha